MLISCEYACFLFSRSKNDIAQNANESNSQATGSHTCTCINLGTGACEHMRTIRCNKYIIFNSNSNSPESGRNVGKKKNNGVGGGGEVKKRKMSKRRTKIRKMYKRKKEIYLMPRERL